MENCEQILVACKLPAEGMNIPGLNNVVLIDANWFADDIYNRCARVGRRGNHGNAYVFYNPDLEGALRLGVQGIFLGTNKREYQDVHFDASSVPGAYTLDREAGQAPVYAVNLPPAVILSPSADPPPIVLTSEQTILQPRRANLKARNKTMMEAPTMDTHEGEGSGSVGRNPTAKTKSSRLGPRKYVGDGNDEQLDP